MKSTGIVRRVDELGRVTIPKEIRRTNGWIEGQPLEIFVEGDRVVLQAFEATDPLNAAFTLLKQAFIRNPQPDSQLGREIIQFLKDQSV